MRVVKISEVKKEPFKHPLFTGPDVMREVLLPDSKELEVNVVNFGRGFATSFMPTTVNKSSWSLPEKGDCHRGGGKGDRRRRCCYYSCGREILARRDQRLGVLAYLCDPFEEQIDPVGEIRLGIVGCETAGDEVIG